MLFWKEDITEIYFVNKYQSKNQKQRYKIIKLLHKAIAKRPIKNPKKSPGIEFVLLSYPGKMIMDNFGCLKSLLFFFLFLFGNEPAKNILWGT